MFISKTKPHETKRKRMKQKNWSWDFVAVPQRASIPRHSLENCWLSGGCNFSTFCYPKVSSFSLFGDLVNKHSHFDPNFPADLSKVFFKVVWSMQSTGHSCNSNKEVSFTAWKCGKFMNIWSDQWSSDILGWGFARHGEPSPQQTWKKQNDSRLKNLTCLSKRIYQASLFLVHRAELLEQQHLLGWYCCRQWCDRFRPDQNVKFGRLNKLKCRIGQSMNKARGNCWC